MWGGDSRKILSGWKAAGVLFAATALFFWQLRNPVIRFSSTIANDVLGFTLAIGLPWLAVISLLRAGRWAKAFAVAAGVPLLLYSGVVFLGIFTMSGSFDRFAERAWKGSRVVLYLTNGGATTDFGVVIRQERVMLAGILLVRRIEDFYPCQSLEVKSTDEGIEISDPSSSCKGFSGRNKGYRLKSFVYF
jgi:hypothetical protein